MITQEEFVNVMSEYGCKCVYPNPKAPSYPFNISAFYGDRIVAQYVMDRNSLFYGAYVAGEPVLKTSKDLCEFKRLVNERISNLKQEKKENRKKAIEEL